MKHLNSWGFLEPNENSHVKSKIPRDPSWTFDPTCFLLWSKYIAFDLVVIDRIGIFFHDFPVTWLATFDPHWKKTTLYGSVTVNVVQRLFIKKERVLVINFFVRVWMEKTDVENLRYKSFGHALVVDDLWSWNVIKTFRSSVKDRQQRLSIFKLHCFFIACLKMDRNHR